MTVIIPHFNDARLPTCVAALAEQTYPNLEVIVVDNDSDVFPKDVLCPVQAGQVLLEKRPGSYMARNLGIKHARGEILAFTDSDCIPTPGWIAAAVEAIRSHDNCGFLGGPVELIAVDADHPTTCEMLDLVFAFPQDENVVSGFSATANMITTREVMSETGPFDDKPKSGSDRLWGRRVIAGGYDGVYADDARVLHPTRRSVRELVNQGRRHVGGNIEIARLGGRRQWLRDIARVLVGSLGRLTRLLRSKKCHGWQKAKVFFLFVFIESVKYMERFRIYLGGTPVR